MSYYFSKFVDDSFDDAIERVTEHLSNEGFGVLTTIDVSGTLKKKLDVDFQRYTIEGLKQAFCEFEIIETGVCVGPGSAITALIADYCELLTFSKNRLLNDIVRTIPLILLWPVKYLDRLLVKSSRAHELASGIYVLARKN